VYAATTLEIEALTILAETDPVIAGVKLYQTLLLTGG
jgi:hypothetical protein